MSLGGNETACRPNILALRKRQKTFSYHILYDVEHLKSNGMPNIAKIQKEYTKQTKMLATVMINFDTEIPIHGHNFGS